MDDAQIETLRKVVAQAKLENARVIWIDDHGKPYVVTKVSDVPVDPDDTGVKDYVAYLNQGHIDLFNVDPLSFSYSFPLFEE